MGDLIRIGDDRHLWIVAQKLKRRVEALRRRDPRGLFSGVATRSEVRELREELTSFGPIGTMPRFLTLQRFQRRFDDLGSVQYSVLLWETIRSRYDARVRSTLGVRRAARISTALEAFAFMDPTPGNATWVAEMTLRTVAYFHFVEMLVGPDGPESRRLARLSMLMDRMIPLGTLRNSPFEWQVLVRSTP